MSANHLHSVTYDTAGTIRPAVRPTAHENEAEAAALTLDSRGMIRDCNKAGEALFKRRRSDLIWRHVSILVPQLANMELVQNSGPNARLRFLSRIGRHFRVVKGDGESFDGELFLNVLDSRGYGHLLLIVRPAVEASPAIASH